ncbi:MAG: hypothetical protein ABSE57_06155 [Bryobacteraceae bacterium]
MIRRVLLIVAITAAALPAATCDRACLQGIVDSYLDALAKHDPSKLPVAASVKFTENGKELKLGEGFWKTAGASTYRLYAIDPQAGDAAAQAVVAENGELNTFFVRLKVKARKISEAETLVCRKGQAGFFAPEKMTAAPALYGEPVKDSERSVRSQLIDDASAYFTAVQTEGTKDYHSAPLSPAMNRFENGVQTTNVPVLGSPAMSGAEQLDKGIFKGLVIDHRRFPVVDEEHGIVVGLVLMHANMNGQMGGILISEMFKIAGKQIQQVQAVMVNVPNDSTTGWK